MQSWLRAGDHTSLPVLRGNPSMMSLCPLLCVRVAQRQLLAEQPELWGQLAAAQQMQQQLLHMHPYMQQRQGYGNGQQHPQQHANHAGGPWAGRQGKDQYPQGYPSPHQHNNQQHTHGNGQQPCCPHHDHADGHQHHQTPAASSAGGALSLPVSTAAGGGPGWGAHGSGAPLALTAAGGQAGSWPGAPHAGHASGPGPYAWGGWGSGGGAGDQSQNYYDWYASGAGSRVAAGAGDGEVEGSGGSGRRLDPRSYYEDVQPNLAWRPEDDSWGALFRR